ncbi:YifB family Mg chelatase-like AAA ATPase [Neisseria sp. Ec49-e6-T10]|uniref:YifB family Mg chelatase-like AAA ATPase n=1 Tax=Neisseria sp. Ec49-e6-T10 TaxID=3140744 RepID=UPI003EBD28FA
MSLAVVYSRALTGMDAPLVEVEAHLANGLPAFNIVGLPETEVKESRDRVRAAILQSGFEFPAKKITVNLAPADLPKESGRFDLPIAVGILAASGQIKNKQLLEYEFAGELALSGALRPIRGALAMVWQAIKAKRTFILPPSSAQSAALVKEAKVLCAPDLLSVCAHLNLLSQLEMVTAPEEPIYSPTVQADLIDVKGQESARFALELAAAGGHSLLFVGPPGTGKSMLATRLPSILPPMNSQELLESASLRSLVHNQSESSFFDRPFRSPHHSASAVALVGGGSNPKPGEISLAHHGVLFLDELPEFDRKVLEVLREPLETGEIHISRANRQATFPARFQLIAAMNPCPCGYLGHATRSCRCSNESVQRYQSKISGPFLDRLDLTVQVPSLSAHELSQTQSQPESSRQVRERVLRARAIQEGRQGKVNASLTVQEIDMVANISSVARETLAELLEKLSLSARSFHRILRVSRTIADLAQEEEVGKHHILRAIAFRRVLTNKA